MTSPDLGRAFEDYAEDAPGAEAIRVESLVARVRRRRRRRAAGIGAVFALFVVAGVGTAFAAFSRLDNGSTQQPVLPGQAQGLSTCGGAVDDTASSGESGLALAVGFPRRYDMNAGGTLVGLVTVINVGDKGVKGHTEIPDVAVAKDGHIVVTPGPKRLPALDVDLNPGEKMNFDAGVVLVRCTPGGGAPETEVTTIDGKRAPVATLEPGEYQVYVSQRFYLGDQSQANDYVVVQSGPQSVTLSRG